MEKFKSVAKKPEFSVAVFLVVISIVTTLISPVFMSADNVIGLLRNISYSAILGIGMTYVVTAGNLDLSIGSTLTITGMATGLCLVSGLPVPVSILLGLLVAFIVGALNALLVLKLGVPSIIATLGMQYISKGVVFVVSKGTPYYPFPKSFNSLGQSRAFGIPISVYIAIVFVVVFYFIFKHTTYGRKVCAIGGNYEAARLSGIKVKRMTASVYVLVAVLAGFVGILMASRMGSSAANTGEGKEMLIIAAVVIGGTSLKGGIGSMIGTVLGVTLMEVLTNALVIVRVSAYWQNVLIGLMMVFAVSSDYFRRKNIKA